MGRSRSRSRSPRRKERRRSRSRSRERDRRRGGPAPNNERDRYRERERDRDRGYARRSRSRSPGPRRRRSRSPPRFRPREESDSDDEVILVEQYNKPHPAMVERRELTESEMEGKSEEEIDMMKLMGFSSFDTTKGKSVVGNDVYVANIIHKRKYRQYMNRKGGFNRPLDFIS